MRTLQAFKNVITNLTLQIAVAISGILIPQFFIAIYGSAVNGLVASISQFITYMGLVEAGIGASGMVALFKPLTMDDKKSVNEIVSAARVFYLRSGMIFVGLVLLLIFVYPEIIENEIKDTSFVRLMIFILSINGIVDYFFLGKYRVLLNADQRAYIISIFQIIGIVIVTVVSLYLMNAGASAVLVKSVAAIVYIMRSVFVAIYVRKKYCWINFKTNPNYKSFGQRWAALTHQIVGMIVNNTDIVLLTLLLPKSALIEVSVYSVYNMVGYSLSNAMTSISNSLGAGFGEVISKDENDILCRTYSSYEYMFYIIIFIIYSCMAVLMYPFMELYSRSFGDAELYTRWSLVALFTLAGLIQTIRLPGLTLIIAAGHYKQTKWRAILEAAINLVISIALLSHLGIVGVLIGTCASYLYRTTDVIVYSSSRFVPGTLQRTFSRIFRNGLICLLLVLIGVRFLAEKIDTWVEWFAYSCGFGITVCILLLFINWILEPDELKIMMRRVKCVIRKK